MMDWVQLRDRWGLVVTFPMQNPELLRMAPELAGLPLHLEIHGVDTFSRRVFAGAELIFQVLYRLPRWRFLAPVLQIPGLSGLCQKVYLWGAARRYRRTGRTPF